jgi:hypothetical protein
VLGGGNAQNGGSQERQIHHNTFASYMSAPFRRC